MRVLEEPKVSTPAKSAATTTGHAKHAAAADPPTPHGKGAQAHELAADHSKAAKTKTSGSRESLRTGSGDKTNAHDTVTVVGEGTHSDPKEGRRRSELYNKGLLLYCGVVL